MSSIPAVSAPVPAQGCLPSFIAYSVDLITSVVSKIFALIGQFFSSIQEVSSRLFCWSATPAPAQMAPAPIVAANATPHHNREQRRAILRRAFLEMQAQHTVKTLELQTALTAEMQAPAAELEASEKNAKLGALKAAAMGAYGRTVQAKQEAKLALAGVRSAQLSTEREPHCEDSTFLAEEARLRFSLAAFKLRIAITEGVMQMQIAHCALESAFLDTQVLRGVVQRVEEANLQPPGAAVVAAESAYRAMKEYFNVYRDAEERCIATLDHLVRFNTLESEQYHRIGQLETEFRSRLTSTSVVGASQLSLVRDGLMAADEKLKAALQNAQQAMTALHNTELYAAGAETSRESLYLTTPGAIQEMKCLDRAILAVEQAYIALLEAGLKGMGACGRLGIVPQFQILPTEVPVPARFDATSVDQFYEPLLRIASLHVQDSEACLEAFRQRLNNH